MTAMVTTSRDVPERDSTPNKRDSGGTITTGQLSKEGRTGQLENVYRDGNTVSLKPKPNLLRNLLPDGAWAGRRCFVIGGGPSAKKMLAKNLKGELVITTNRSFERYPESAMNVSIDTRFYMWLKTGELGDKAVQAWEQYGGGKVWLSYPHEGFTDPDVLEVERFTDRPSWRYSIDAGCGPTLDSGMAAVQLALSLGAGPVYLVGFDMKGNGKGKQAHHHEPYPIVADESIYEYKFLPAWREFAKGIGTRAKDVINLNLDSALDCFDKPKGLDIKPGATRPTVVGFYTRNTPYAGLALNMKRSAAMYGLQTHLEQYDSTGTWAGNVRLKPGAILKALKLYDRVLYVDADHLFRAYPAYFDDLDADMAYPVLDWDKNDKPRSGKEILSGTLYFRRTEATIKLLEAWQAECEAAKGRDAVDGAILQERIIRSGLAEKLGVKAVEMPIENCHIGGFSAGAPVIQAGQASRKLRAVIDANE